MPKPATRALCWLRRDLRTTDNAALAEATFLAGGVAAAFVFDTNILDSLLDRDDRRLTFIHRSLVEVDQKLRAAGSKLVVLHGDPKIEIPKLARALRADTVVASRDYEPYAQQRDEAVAAALQVHGSQLVLVKDSVIREGGELLTQGGAPFRVYGPYARAWRGALVSSRDAGEHQADLRCLMDRESLLGFDRPWELPDIGFVPSELWLEPGEAAGWRRLNDFASRIADYGKARDFPALDGTSGLSVHLRFGTVSVRQALRFAMAAGSSGEKWLGELIWRDFYQDILFHHPHVVDLPFQAQYGNLQYPGHDEHFEAWCEGRTGYPIVDAAMRCLNQTGWMHNRLRMVVASFLTKDLLVDYRKGEAYFARKLLDFELASNNGGWQWAASTGADPQPYFRVFNPVLQSQKFDPNGAFIRRYVPELAELQGPALHFPAAATEFELVAARIELGRTYPHPIVDHKEQRERAIELLAAAKSG
jgi:deoxyribodipyrimidine photo-lyase